VHNTGYGRINPGPSRGCSQTPRGSLSSWCLIRRRWGILRLRLLATARNQCVISTGDWKLRYYDMTRKGRQLISLGPGANDILPRDRELLGSGAQFHGSDLRRISAEGPRKYLLGIMQNTYYCTLMHAVSVSMAVSGIYFSKFWRLGHKSTLEEAIANSQTTSLQTGNIYKYTLAFVRSVPVIYLFNLHPHHQ